MHPDYTQLVTEEFKSGVKVELKWSFEVEFLNPSFHPDLLKTGIQKVEFQSSLNEVFKWSLEQLVII